MILKFIIDLNSLLHIDVCVNVFSGRWECPWHQCSVCQRPASTFCHFCPASFCREHEGGQLALSARDGRPCCSKHDPAQTGQARVKQEPLEPGEEEEEEVEEEAGPEEGGAGRGGRGQNEGGGMAEGEDVGE